MDTNLMTMPGYRYAEYLLVLNPHEDLRQRITSVRKDFAEAYQTGKPVTGKPHIALATFTVWEMMEEKILNRLRVAAMGAPPFKVGLKDYGSFPSHTIYINVTTKIPVQNLVKEIRQAQRLMKSPDHDPHFIAEPFITVARKLTPAQYESAWKEYAHRNFTASFIADAMLLLKRREGQKGYQILERFQFMNLPVATKQGELFI
jgi:2'-5' RNA ligase